MKGTAKKIISIVQVLIIILTSIIPLFAVVVREAEAAEINDLTINRPGSGLVNFSGIENLSAKLRISAKGTEDCFTRYNSPNHIYIDKGIKIWSNPTDNKGTWYTEVYAGEISGETNADNALFTVIGNSMIDFSGYTEECYTIVTKKEESISVFHWVEEIGRAYIHIVDFGIKLDSDNIGVNSEGTRCDTAIIEGNTLYVAPGTTTTLVAKRPGGTIPSDKGTYIFEGGIGTITDNRITIRSSTQIGKTGTIKWSNVNGSTSSINVVVSNFWSYDISLQSKSNASISSGKNYYMYNGSLIETSKTVFTTKEKTATISIYPKEEFENKKVVLASLEVVDVTGCLEQNAQINQVSDHYEVSLNTKSNGVIKIIYKNYEGAEYIQNWYINCANGEAVTIIPATDIKTDIITQTTIETQTETPTETTITGNTTTTQKTPTINVTAEKVSSDLVRVDVTTTNATAAKYLIKERETGEYVNPVKLNTKYNEYTTADGWKEITTPNKFSIYLRANILGSGKYDVTVLAKNGNDSVITTSGIGPHYINAAPVCGITEVTQLKKANSRTFTMYATSSDRDTVLSYYYVQAKNSVNDKIDVSVDTIKEEGISFTGSTQITINTDNYEAGFYDIIVYVEDEHGMSRTSKVSNVSISNVPEVTYEIEGENGSTYTKTINNKQKVNIKIKDIDENNKLNVWYYISENDSLDNSTVEKFYKNGSAQYKSFSSNTASFSIELAEENAVQTSKYIYLLVQDNLGATILLQTAEIKVDGTDLKLIEINSEQIKENESVGLSIGEKLKVSCVFNHNMKESYPDLYLNFGTTQRKQDTVECENNVITYVYKISEKDANGNVSVSKFDYSKNKFVDTYTSANVYAKQIDEDKNITNVLGKTNFYVDTTIPKIQNVEIAYTTDENSIVIDDTAKNVKYIADIGDIQCKVTYSEGVIGSAVSTYFVKGNKYTSCVNTQNNNISTELRNVDVYSLIKDKKAFEYSGNFVLESFGNNKDLTDKAGNKVDLSNYNVTYTLDGKNLGNTKIILDDTIHTGKIYINEENVDKNYTAIIGSEVVCFAEYKNKNEQDYKDESGIENITLTILNTENEIILKDKDGNEVVKNNKEGIFQYELTEEKLPVSFELKNAGEYIVVADKTDRLGNKVSKKVNIQAKNVVEISDKSSTNITDGKVYSYIELSEEQKEYNLLLELAEVEAKDVTVYVINSSSKLDGSTLIDVVYNGQVTQDNVNYESYKFDIIQSQIYKVKVVNNSNNEVIYEDIIELDNVYLPGDANFDGKIDSSDAVCILRNIAGYTHDAKLKYAGDVNGDGKNNITDVILLNRFLAEDQKIMMDKNTGHIKLK